MNKPVAIAILLIAAIFEAGGDALVRMGLHQQSGAVRWMTFLGGAAVLFAYGLTVNAPDWDFGRVLGIYVVFFFVTAQLMSWPTSDSPGLFPLVRGSSQAAASSVSGGVFIPAGDAWRLALERDQSVQLYGGDGYHPGPLGTYLAALVVYEKVTGHDCRTLPGRAVVGGATLSASETQVRFLQNIAHETVALYK